MFATQDIAGFSQAQIEKSIRLSGIVLSGVERFVNLNLDVARDLLSDNASAAKAFSEVKDVPSLIALQQKLSQPAVDKALSVAKSVYEAGSSTQAELTQVVEENVVEFNKTLAATLDKALKSAPAGSEAVVSSIKTAFTTAASAYDAVSKTAKKVTTDLAQAGVSAAETSAKAARPVAAVKKSAAPAAASAA